MNKRKAFSILVLLVLVAPSAFSAGLRIGFMDSFALGRGNAFAATADNPSAIFYNPAGITQLDENELSVGTLAMQFSSEHTADDTSTKMRDRFRAVPHFYYAFKTEHTPVTFGIGAYLPFGLTTDWPDDSPFRALATRSELTYLRLNPVASYEVNSQLSIGAGPTINFADIDLRSQPQQHRYRLQGNDTAIGFNIGGRWQPHPQHAFGLSYHSPTRIGFDGSDRIRGPLLNGDGDASIDNLTFPEIAIAGYSFRPTPNWNLEANIDWTRWSRFDDTTINSDFNNNGDLELNWDDTFFYGIGATRYFSNDHFLSAGYLYTENAVPAETFHPFVPDSSFHFLSLGVGSTGKIFTWQGSYHYGHGGSRNVPHSGDPQAGTDPGGKYRNHIHSVSLTLALTF